MGEQWYSNKDLFERIMDLQKEMRTIPQLRQEMEETRRIIKKYNGLYEKLDNVKRKVDHIESVTEGKNSTKEAIRQWGGWLFGFITLLVLLYTTFIN